MAEAREYIVASWLTLIPACLAAGSDDCPNFGIYVGAMPIPVAAEASIETQCYRIFAHGWAVSHESPLIGIDRVFRITDNLALGLGLGGKDVTKSTETRSNEPYQDGSGFYTTRMRATRLVGGPTFRFDWEKIENNHFRLRWNIVGGMLPALYGEPRYSSNRPLTENAELVRKAKSELEMDPGEGSHLMFLTIAWGLIF